MLINASKQKIDSAHERENQNTVGIDLADGIYCSIYDGHTYDKLGNRIKTNHPDSRKKLNALLQRNKLRQNEGRFRTMHFSTQSGCTWVMSDGTSIKFG